MADPRRTTGRRVFQAGVAVLLFCALGVGLSAFRLSRAANDPNSDDDDARQVTVFGVLATPNGKAPDSNLASIHTQLDKLLPKHGFRLLDAQSKRIEAGEAVTCKLSGGYTVVTSLIKSSDENGKAELRCELFLGDHRQFSTLVKTPLHQLFFCEKALDDGTKLLIGVGAR